jgi:cell division protein FtsL
MVRRKLSRKDILLGASAGALLFSVLTFYLWHSAENVRWGYAVGQAEDDLRSLRNDIRILKTKKAARLAPAVVDRIAREKLGLQDPREDQIILEDD